MTPRETLRFWQARHDFQWTFLTPAMKAAFAPEVARRAVGTLIRLDSHA